MACGACQQKYRKRSGPRFQKTFRGQPPTARQIGQAPPTDTSGALSTESSDQERVPGVSPDKETEG